MAMTQRERQTARSRAIPEVTEWRRAYTPLPDFDAGPALARTAELKDFWDEVAAAFRKTTLLLPLAGSLALGAGLLWWATGGEKTFDAFVAGKCRTVTWRQLTQRPALTPEQQARLKDLVPSTYARTDWQARDCGGCGG